MIKVLKFKNMILYLFALVAICMGVSFISNRDFSFALTDLEVTPVGDVTYNQSTGEYEYTRQYDGSAVNISSLVEISMAGSPIMDSSLQYKKYIQDKTTELTEDLVNVGVYYVNITRSEDAEFNAVDVWVKINITRQLLNINNVKVFEDLLGEKEISLQENTSGILTGVANDREYDGSLHQIYAEITDNQGESLQVGYYYTISSTSGDLTTSEIKNVGQYLIRINVLNNSNYYIADIVISLEITPTEVVSFGVYENQNGEGIIVSSEEREGTAKNREYKLDESNHEIYAELFGLGGEQLNVKYTYYKTSDLSIPLESIVDAGEYVIVITNDSITSANYKMDKPIKVFITIDKYSSDHYSASEVSLDSYKLYVGQPISAIANKIVGSVYTTQDDSKEEITGRWDWKNPTVYLSDDTTSTSQTAVFIPEDPNFESYETTISDIFAQYLKVVFRYSKNGVYVQTSSQNIFYNTSINNATPAINVPTDYDIVLGKDFNWSISLDKQLTEADVDENGLILLIEKLTDIVYTIVYRDSLTGEEITDASFITRATLSQSAELKSSMKTGYVFQEWSYLVNGEYQSVPKIENKQVVSILYCLDLGLIDNQNKIIYVYAVWKLQAPESVIFENIQTNITYNGTEGITLKVVNVQSSIKDVEVYYSFVKIEDTEIIVKEFSKDNSYKINQVAQSGTYKAKVKFVLGNRESEVTESRQIKIQINPAEPLTSKNVKNISEYYTGYEMITDIELVGVEDEVLEKEVKYYYAKKVNGEYEKAEEMDGNPLNVGNYIAVVKANNDNYTEKTFEQVIHIYKREIYVSQNGYANVFYNSEEDKTNNNSLVIDQVNSLFLAQKTYTGNSQQIYSNVIYNGKNVDVDFIYCLSEGFDRSNSETWTVVDEMINAGTYYVIAKSGDPNLDIVFRVGDQPLPVVIKVDIAKANLTAENFGSASGPQLEQGTVLYAGQPIGEILDKVISIPTFNGKTVEGEYHWVKEQTDGSYKIDDGMDKTSANPDFSKTLMFFVGGKDEQNLNDIVFKVSVPVEMLTVKFVFNNFEGNIVNLTEEILYGRNANLPEEYDEYYHTDLTYARQHCYADTPGKKLVWEGGSYENIKSPTTLTAKLIDIIYTIVYQSNHSAFIAPTKTTLSYEDKEFLPSSPNAIQGYSFGGWQCKGDNLTGERIDISQINVREFVEKNRIEENDTITIYARYVLNAPEVTLTAENNILKGSYGDTIVLNIDVTEIIPSEGDTIIYSYEWFKGSYEDNTRIEIGKQQTSLSLKEVDESGLYFVKVMASDNSQNSNETMSQSLLVSITPKAVKVEFEGIRNDFKDGDPQNIQAYYIDNNGNKVKCENISGLPQSTLQKGSYKLIAKIEDSNYVALDNSNIVSFSVKGTDKKMDGIMIMLISFIAVAAAGVVVTLIVIISFKKGRLSLIDAKKEAEEQDKQMEEMVKNLPEEINEDQRNAFKNEDREKEMLKNLGLLTESVSKKKSKSSNKTPSKDNKDSGEKNDI